jgi:NADH:ubiquinone oxidoreductase subunit 5 (subunit L)/multisubunit Na+/H+ antiporter MnhA subunit
MNTELKRKLSNLANGIITLAMAIIVLWFIIFVVQTTFNLNVFAERTSESFLTIIFAAIAIIVSAAFLSMSLNISLIADAKMQEQHSDPSHHFGKWVVPSIVLGGLVVVLLLFAGDYLSRSQQKTRLLRESKDLLDKYSASVDSLAVSLTDTSKITIVPGILKFLSTQRDDFSDVSLIVKTEFNGQTTFLHANSSTNVNNLKEPYFDFSFYRCKKEDNDYLFEVFKKGKVDVFVWSEKSEHYLYYPITSHKITFVLMFSKYNRYGKFGS